ncbi:HK97 family phage prohead protease, partial [Vibrio parahaemolyticus]|uniref:HK97 family phage prohead protease n=2 Tax=Pseudomonadota TaxID=1224 RepID=UPI001A903575
DALRLKGRLLIDKVSRAAEVFALLKEGAIKGVSIGFNPIKYTSRAGGGRAYSLIDLLECSVVAVPCHPGAAITSVKS